MNDIFLVTLLSQSLLWWYSSADYFHVPSMLLIYPDEKINNSDFGFSMGFQSDRNNLVVGAPSVDLRGKVYSCLVSDDEPFGCQENPIDFHSIASYSKDPSLAGQHFYTGASIATTSEHFLTCAPLWTMPTIADVSGTCFVFDQNNPYPQRYMGTYERYARDKVRKRSIITNTKSFIGGTGWSTLADEDNGLLLIIKTSLDGDILYTPLNKPTEETKSILLQGELTFNNDHYRNIGFGIAAGKFFSDKTVYAFSVEKSILIGIIEFIEYDTETKELFLINENIQNDEFTIESKAVGAMFGSVLATAVMTPDGFDDLLVGAPTYSEEDCTECGALYIYLGGDMENIGKRDKLRIVGNKELGRFSSAIVAKDLDGDAKTELIVSAPYEDDGIGAVYILSGYEVYEKLLLPENLQLSLKEFKRTQRIQKETFRRFGFSLQFISDIDNNGCSDLVAGSPGNGTVVLFKCFQSINVTLSSMLLGEQIVKEQDKNFTVKVCAVVNYPKEPLSIIANLKVKSNIIGANTYIPNPEFDIDVSCNGCPKNDTICKEVTVLIKGTDPGDYVFHSEAQLDTSPFYRPAFNSSWVIVSPYSKLNKKIEIPRHCSGNDCIPALSMELQWSGRTDEPYYLESSGTANVTIRVTNHGNSSYEACIRMRVQGAVVSYINCSVENDMYKCNMPKPLRRDEQYTTELIFNMTEPTNENTELQVEASLYENCNQESVIKNTTNLNIPYVMSVDNIFVYGISRDRNVSEKHMQDDKSFISNDQEYLITNNGTIRWKRITSIISMKNSSYIHSFEVTVDKTNCLVGHLDNDFNYICTLELKPNSTQKIIATTKIFKESIVSMKQLNITSEMNLRLQPTGKIMKETVKTVLTYRKDLSIVNNKLLIGLIAGLLGLLILIIIIAVLYKYGFFERKQKQRLHVFRESLKQRNSRRNTHVSSTADGQGLPELQMDVDDDNAFVNIPIPQTTKNGVVLIEEKAQVHC